MTEKKLNIDLSSLWENPRNRFTVRFNDINEQQKINLTKSIKETAPQSTIRHTEKGPTIEQLYKILEEINPIIFSEHDGDGFRASTNRFRKYWTTQLEGYRFKQLCIAIYCIIYRKKAKTYKDLRRILATTSTDYTKTEDLIRSHLEHNRLEITPTITPIEDIGVENISTAARRAEREGAGRIPQELLEREEIVISPTIVEPINEIEHVTEQQRDETYEWLRSTQTRPHRTEMRTQPVDFFSRYLPDQGV